MPLKKTVMPLTETVIPLEKKITNFSPYLKDDGVLDLNIEGNKFSIREGQSKNEGVKFSRFEDTFDVRKLVEFIKTTPGVKGFKATLWGIGEMDISDFRRLVKAIKESEITDLNFRNNTLSPKMVDEISKLNKLSNLSKLIKCIECTESAEITEITVLDISSCKIYDKEIKKIVKGLPNLEELNLENNGITDTGIYAIVKYLSKIKVFNGSFNSITDAGANAIATKGFGKIKEIVIPYGNNISVGALQEIVKAHPTLTKFDPFSTGYTKQQILEIVDLLPINCVLQLGPHWTRGVNDNNEAPINLNGVVWGSPPVDPIGVVENLEV